ncbi:MAG: hypothetical protein FWC95_02245 [Defluviitaleaceae bacterium]|nr:hypothetical protein [Defluviitaleaceae bacterium]
MLRKFLILLCILGFSSALSACTARDDDSHNVIMEASLTEAIANAADFLGVELLRKEVTLFGFFMTVDAVTRCIGSIDMDVHLIFHVDIMNDTEYAWRLLEYRLGPLSGPGQLDAARSWWQWETDEWFRSLGDFNMLIYNYSDWNEFEMITETITADNWKSDVIHYMYLHTGIRIADIWVENGHMLVVDLTPAGAIPFDWGSTGSINRMNSLHLSMTGLRFNERGVGSLKIPVGGQRGIYGSHFSFVTPLDIQ